MILKNYCKPIQVLCNTIANGGAQSPGIDEEEGKKEEIRELLKTNPSANIYDWLSTTAFTSDNEERTITYYNDKMYKIPNKTIQPDNFSDWIAYWNDVSGQDLKYYNLPINEDISQQRYNTI